MRRILFLLAFSLAAASAWGQGCTSTATIAPPATAPFSGLTGAGTAVADPEPVSGGNSSGCFHNPILRVSDGNTPTAACVAQGTTCAGKANQSMFVNGSDGEDNQWSTDDSQFSTTDSGSVYYIWDFHGMNSAPTVRYSNFGGALKMFSFPTASHVTAKLYYSLANSAGTAKGTALSSYDTSQTWPTLPTRTAVYDFASSANGVPNTATFPTDPIAANFSDSAFGTGFSTSGLQGTGIYVAEYVSGSGVTVWNTSTGMVSGDWGTTGAVVCQNCGGPTNPGNFSIHNVKWSRDLTYAMVQLQSGTCSSTCYNGPDPYLWQAGTNKVWITCLAGSGKCSGHSLMGQTVFINNYDTALYISKPLPGNTGTLFPSASCGHSSSPSMDQHASWWNDNATDTKPFFVSTTSEIVGNPVYNACGVQEIDAIDPPAIGDGLVYRFGHNYGYKTAEFAVYDELMTVSPSGKYAIFTSPMGNSSNLGQLGDTSGTYPCTVAANCRGDAFVLGLTAPVPPSFTESLCTTDLLAPAPVHNNLIEGTHIVTLSWNPSGGALWYRVYRGTATGGPYTLLADCVGATSYVDLVGPSQTLFYMVTAVNGGGASSNSSEAPASIPLFDTLTGFESDATSVQIGETLSTVDALLPTSTQIAVLSETLSTSDVLAAGRAHSLSLSETLTTSDALIPAATFQRMLVENISINDSLGDNFHKTAGMGESLTTLDALNQSFLAMIGLAENLSTSDAIAATATTHSASLAENLATSDNFSLTGTFQYGLGESLTTVDALTLTVTLPGGSSNGTAIYSLGNYGIAPVRACAFTLQIFGQGFTSQSIVTWNGAVRASAFISPRQLQITLLSVDLAAAGSVPVIVWLGSYATTARYFSVVAATPTIDGARVAGGALIVDGKNFVPGYGVSPGIVSAGSTLFWNGQPLSTSWISPTRLQAIMPAKTFAIGNAAITVADAGCFQ